MNEDDELTEEDDGLSEEDELTEGNKWILSKLTDLYDEINFLKVQIKRMQASLLMLTKNPPPSA